MKKSQELLDVNELKGKKVALVHDFLVCLGGAERVLREMADMFPEAPIYTLLYDKEAMRETFADRDIRPSFVQQFPLFLRKRYRWLLPFFPVAVEAFDLRDFDVVISSSGAWSKGIVTRLHTKHIAYIHSPMRFVWDYNERYMQEAGGKRMGLIKRMVLCYMRMWDREAADRPDVLIANSLYTHDRIAKYYRRESTVVYPPVASYAEAAPSSEHSFFGFQSKEYFLVVSRLTPNKKVALVVEAFNKLSLPLIVVGEGTEKASLKALAKENIKIVGYRSDRVVDALYVNARAFLFPAEDDFGMTMVEAMQRGTPVIAYGRGGAREIVTEGVTGEFFSAQTPELIANGVRRFLEKEEDYTKEALQKSAERFSPEIFREAIVKEVD